MPVTLGFLSLGFLIGNLVGLTASSAVTALIPLLFAFGGGSAVAFLGKLEGAQRRQAGAAVGALSCACLVGVYTGILVSEYQVLSPRGSKRAVAATSLATSASATTLPPPAARFENKYLRSDTIPANVWIDNQYKAGKYTIEEAYQLLQDSYAGVLRQCQPSGGESSVVAPDGRN